MYRVSNLYLTRLLENEVSKSGQTKDLYKKEQKARNVIKCGFEVQQKKGNSK